MIARSAFTQLRYSATLLALTLIGLSLVWLAPVALMLEGRPWERLCGFVAFALSVASYLPTLGRYGRSPLWAPALPLIAAVLHGGDRGIGAQHWRGTGARWKSRSYGGSEYAGSLRSRRDPVWQRCRIAASPAPNTAPQPDSRSRRVAQNPSATRAARRRPEAAAAPSSSCRLHQRRERLRETPRARVRRADAPIKRPRSARTPHRSWRSSAACGGELVQHGLARSRAICANARSTSRHMMLPDPSQIEFTGISRTMRASGSSSV